jgi:hypothetical protein
MATDKLRRQITAEAGRLMYTRSETEYYRAKLKAARKICGRWVKPADLPSNAEIRDEIQRVAWMFEGDARFDNLREMRLFALRMLRLLARFKPRLIGSTLTGHVRRGSDIDVHLFTSSLEAVTGTLDEQGLRYDVERKRVRKSGEEHVYTHIHVQDRFEVELTCYSPELANYPFKSSITGQEIERADLHELEELIRAEYPDVDLDAALGELDQQVDRFQIYRMLLIPLEKVEQGKTHHPEGDALYHSLQVFALARDESPWDEELLLAALLHDVGKGLDPLDHVAAALEALDGYVTDRTAWLIENHMEAHRLHDGTLGARAKRRLQEHEDYDSLLLLGRCDREGRVPGAQVPDLDEALDAIREVARLCG